MFGKRLLVIVDFWKMLLFGRLKSFALQFPRYLWKDSVHFREFLDRKGFRFIRPMEVPITCLRRILGIPFYCWPFFFPLS